MVVYKYSFNMNQGTTNIEEYECSPTIYRKEKAYHLRGTGRCLSESRIKKFLPYKSGNFLLAWSFEKDKIVEFKKRCLNKVIELRDRTILNYDMLAVSLIKEIENEVK